MLIINGITVASPVSGAWDDSSIASPESGRDSGADMNLDIVSEKKTFPYTWGWLTGAETSVLLKAIKLNGIANINITRHNPEENRTETYNCYAGDRHVPDGMEINGETFYNGITVTFIEN